MTVNMSTRNCVFYATREDVKKSLAQSLRINGFQVQTEEEKDFDDVASMHSGVSNFTDINNNKPQLSSLLIHDKNIPFRNTGSTNSIIQERYSNNNNNNNNNEQAQYVDNSANNSLLSVGGPTYPDQQTFSQYDLYIIYFLFVVFLYN